MHAQGVSVWQGTKNSYHKQCPFYVKSAKKIYSRGTSSLQVRSQGSGGANEPHRLRCEFRLRSLADDLAASSTNSQTLHGSSAKALFMRASMDQSRMALPKMLIIDLDVTYIRSLRRMEVESLIKPEQSLLSFREFL